MAQGPGKVTFPQLVALDSVFCGAADFGSQDCNEACFCGDAGAFVIKKSDKAPTLPHSEWFCSSIAASCGVPQIAFSIIRHTDGNHWFGSSWKTGIIKEWWNLALNGTINFSEIAEDISRIYALDLFIHNDDRHFNNYIVVKEEASHRAYSLDYSRAWLHHGFPPPPILISPKTNTVKNKEWLKSKFGTYLDIVAMEQVLDNISRISNSGIFNIISGHPKHWLTQSQEDAIINWWIAGKAVERVDLIKAGIKDGSLL